MIKYCYDRWNSEQQNLKKALEEYKELDSCNYLDLVKIVTQVILGEEWNANKIHEIDDGDYQGTLVYLIPRDSYQPTNTDYLLTYVWYGSCSGCDTLMGIQSDYYGDENNTEKKIKDYMTLCKDIVMNMIHPYSGGYCLDTSSLDIVVTVDD